MNKSSLQAQLIQIDNPSRNPLQNSALNFALAAALRSQPVFGLYINGIGGGHTGVAKILREILQGAAPFYFHTRPVWRSQWEEASFSL